MSISTKCAEALLWIYKGSNRIGLLDSRIVRSAYISAYFTYKKYIEDSFAKLTQHYGHFFKNGHILDIGANIGYTAYVFSKIISDEYTIFAFEPEKRNLDILKQASQQYHFSHKLITVPTAVGDYNGEIELWQNDAHNGDHRILTDELKKQLGNQIQIQKTPIITIDHYLKNTSDNKPIAFIKIDVQGYEQSVCQGMTATLENHPDAIIGFEYCPSIIEALGFQPEALLQFFMARGYQFFVLNKQNRIEKYDIEKGQTQLRQIRPHDYVDILCARRDLL